MGAELWVHWVPYQTDLEQSLKRLQTDVLRSGLYRGNHLNAASREEAVANVGADGTASVLDIDVIADDPAPGVICPMPEDELLVRFGSLEPTRERIVQNMGFVENIDRGQGRYVIAYSGGKPTEILFCGWSYD